MPEKLRGLLGMDSLLGGWENFYVIVGTTAGGLTGLTFVVIALIRDASKVTPTGLGAFVTPTIVHFGGVLALAAFLSMPHQNPLSLSIGFGVAGVAGLIYCGFIAVGIRRQAVTYTPVLEDWLFNCHRAGPGVCAAAHGGRHHRGYGRPRLCSPWRRRRSLRCSSASTTPGTSRSSWPPAPRPPRPPSDLT